MCIFESVIKTSELFTAKCVHDKACQCLWMHMCVYVYVCVCVCDRITGGQELNPYKVSSSRNKLTTCHKISHVVCACVDVQTSGSFPCCNYHSQFKRAANEEGW